MALHRVGETASDPLETRASVLLPLVVIVGAAAVRWTSGLAHGEPMDGTLWVLTWLLALGGLGLVEALRR